MTDKQIARDKLLKGWQAHTEIRPLGGRFRKMLHTTLEECSAQSALLYSAKPGWGEIDVSYLVGEFPDIDFDVVPSSNNPPFPQKRYDVIIVPLLGFTKNGYRLGRGGGWYDKFLKTQSHALKIGVGHEQALVDFEHEAHDIPMDVIVTEKMMRDFRLKRSDSAA